MEALSAHVGLLGTTLASATCNLALACECLQTSPCRLAANPAARILAHDTPNVSATEALQPEGFFPLALGLRVRPSPLSKAFPLGSCCLKPNLGTNLVGHFHSRHGLLGGFEDPPLGGRRRGRRVGRFGRGAVAGSEKAPGGGGAGTGAPRVPGEGMQGAQPQEGARERKAKPEKKEKENTHTQDTHLGKS